MGEAARRRDFLTKGVYYEEMSDMANEDQNNTLTFYSDSQCMKHETRRQEVSANQIPAISPSPVL